MSAGKIYQMSVAAQAAGGDFDQVSGMLLRFSSSVKSAVDGSAKMIDSFAKIGVSRQDLEFLSDEQLFQAVVSGLGNMTDGAEKTALAVELLGKKAATTDLKQFADDISQTVDPSVERNLLNAAKAVDNVEKAFRDLQMAALQVFSPIIEVIGKFEFSVDSAAQSLRVFSAVFLVSFCLILPTSNNSKKVVKTSTLPSKFEPISSISRLIEPAPDIKSICRICLTAGEVPLSKLNT
jgi:hypothetical protein